MDWSKAKTILIIAFLILNIFMLIMLAFNSANVSITSDYIRYSKDYLTAKNIEIRADIPRVPRYTGKVLYSTREYDIDALCRLVFGKKVPLSENEGAMEIVVGEEMIIFSEDELNIKDRISEGEQWFSDIKTFEDRLIKYLKNIGFKKSELLLIKSSETEQEKELIFDVKYKNLKVYDQQITAQVNKESILTLSVPAKMIKKENGTGQVISAYQILVMGGLPSNIVVENIDIGYRRISKGDLYGVPMWCITTDDGAIWFFNGFTGEQLD